MAIHIPLILGALILLVRFDGYQPLVTGENYITDDPTNETSPDVTTQWLTSTSNPQLVEYYRVMAVIQQASQHILFKIASSLTVTYLPVVCVLGLAGNLLSAIIMFKPRNRKISCCIYMGALAVVDSVPLLVSVRFILTDGIFLVTETHLDCSFIMLAWVMTSLASVFIVIVMTFDRLMAIRHPLKAKMWCTPRRSKIAIFSCIVAAIIFKSPYVFLVKTIAVFGSGTCTVQFPEDGGIYWTIYSWINSFVSSYLPFALLLTMNLILIYNIRRRGKFFAKTAGNQGQPKSAEVKSKDIELTVLLVMVSVMLLVLTSPAYIGYICVQLGVYSNRFDTPFLYARYFLVLSFNQRIHVTNHAINFFLYCAGGSKFRKEVWDLFCKRDKSQKSQSGVSTKVSNVSN